MGAGGRSGRPSGLKSADPLVRGDRLTLASAAGALFATAARVEALLARLADNPNDLSDPTAVLKTVDHLFRLISQFRQMVVNSLRNFGRVR